MFETLTDRLNHTFKQLAGRGRISEENVRDAMREVRRSLLEADVNLEVVTEFCEEVTQEALGTEVLKSLKPQEQMVGIVHNNLKHCFGDGFHTFSSRTSLVADAYVSLPGRMLGEERANDVSITFDLLNLADSEGAPGKNAQHFPLRECQIQDDLPGKLQQ